jgi:hypothetical protein
VEQLTAKFALAEQTIRQGCALIAQGESLLSESFAVGEGRRSIEFRGRDHRSCPDFSAPDECVGYLREQCWRVLTERLEIRRMMSIAKSKELSTWLDKEAGKELITSETVLGFFRYYVENLETMLEEAVVEVYDFLRPRPPWNRDEYKTNSQYRVGKKVIVTGWVGPWFKNDDRIRVNSHYQDHFVALENVFLALDGRGSITKGYRTELEAAIEKAPTGETTYFKYRACLNRNLHLEFKRPDLVQKFNEIAGRKFLGKGSDDAAA